MISAFRLRFALKERASSTGAVAAISGSGTRAVSAQFRGEEYRPFSRRRRIAAVFALWIINPLLWNQFASFGLQVLFWCFATTKGSALDGFPLGLASGCFQTGAASSLSLALALPWLSLGHALAQPFSGDN
jgi:hypothetical protein